METIHTILLVPGSKAEADAVSAAVSSEVDGNARTAAAGGGWTWQTALLPGVQCKLRYTAVGSPALHISTAAGAPIAFQLEQAEQVYSIGFETPGDLPPGGRIHIRFQAGAQPIRVRYFSLELTLIDSNGDGINDWVTGFLGAGIELKVVPRPTEPHTSFFYAFRYDADMAVPTDAVRLYFWSVVDDAVIFPNWTAKGFTAQVMLHSRYLSDHTVNADSPDVQKDRSGQPLGVHQAMRGSQVLDLIVPLVNDQWKADVAQRFGPDFEVKCVDYYRVPHPERDEYANRQYTAALEAGASGFGYDEPEFWTYAGYSETFQKEWLAYYRTPWEPPHTSVDARYKADRLKGFLFKRQVQTVLQDVARRSPDAVRLLSAHSPINYYLINIACPHNAIIQLPEVQEVIAEVWTGTERVPVPLAGVIAERTFEVGFLEYSSFYQLVRGLGKRLWFLHDPLEDRPNLPMEDYHRNYVRTVVASLMCPDVDNYEVLVWPNRVYGCVPKEYETLVNTVVGALCELWRFKDIRCDFGSDGIGTFIADSMGWQRDDPHPSNYSDFWGLTLPLVANGVPIQVLSLDRVTEPGYLDSFQTLLISYDFLKPASAAMNQALADWASNGGTLLIFGGSDAYCALKDSWWQQAGYASPTEDLFARLGIPLRNAEVRRAEGYDLELQASSGSDFPGPQNLTIPSSRVDERSHERGGSVVLLPDQVAGSCQVTLYQPPADARPLYQLRGAAAPAVWQAKTGRGRAIFAGVNPRFMAVTAQGADWLRSLVCYSRAQAGAEYREQPYFRIKRGPYTAISALDQPYSAAGQFVDLFSADLTLLENPVVPAHECAFWVDAGTGGDLPHILAVSGRVRAYSETPAAACFLSQSPRGTIGAARIWTAGRVIRRVTAVNTTGEDLSASWSVEGQTALVRYVNDADGASVRIEWE